MERIYSEGYKEKITNDIKEITYNDLLIEKLSTTGIMKDYYNSANIFKNSELSLLINKPYYTSILTLKEKVRNEKFQDWSIISKMNERLELKKVTLIKCWYNFINQIV